MKFIAVLISICKKQVQIIRFRQAKRKECDGKVIKIEKTTTFNGTPAYLIECEYLVDGKSYTCIYYTRETKKYNLGMMDKVYYKENNPTKAVTKNQYKESIQDVATFLLILIIFFCSLLFMKYLREY